MKIAKCSSILIIAEREQRIQKGEVDLETGYSRKDLSPDLMDRLPWKKNKEDKIGDTDDDNPLTFLLLAPLAKARGIIKVQFTGGHQSVCTALNKRPLLTLCDHPRLSFYPTKFGVGSVLSSKACSSCHGVFMALRNRKRTTGSLLL